MAKLIVTWGSLRAESWNRKVIEIAARSAEQAGASVTVVDPREYRLPIFDEDLESKEGLPKACTELKDLFLAHDGFLIGCPEYNSSISAQLKNMIDWVSRPRHPDKPLAPFAGKVAGLCAASPGAIGGLRGLFHVRAILQNIKVIVNPTMAAVTTVHEHYNESTKSLDHEGLLGMVESVGSSTAELAKKLGG